MFNRLVAVIAAALLIATAGAPAFAANTFNVQVNASTLATVTVTTSGTGTVICDPGTNITGIIACTNTVNATGNIRSTKGGTGSLTATAPAATIAGTSGNTLAVSASR